MLLRILLVLFVVGRTASQVDFECDPYGTIFVTNPKPDTLRFAHAVDYLLLGNNMYDESSFLCPTFMLGVNHPTVIIEPNNAGYCGKGRAIMLTLSNVSIHETLIVNMPYKENYIVRCLDIPDTGITVNVTQGMKAINFAYRFHKDARLLPGVNYTFLNENYIVRCLDIPDTGITVNVTQERKAIDEADDVLIDYDIEDIGKEANFDNKVISRLYPCCEFNENTKQQTTALVGTHLLWTLDVYNDYYLLPLMCRAHAGQNTTGSPSAVLLDEGCSADKRLVTYRTTLDNWTARQRRLYMMNLFAFHFYNSPYVTIVCHVKVCPIAGKENCEWACDDRRRRSVPESGSLSSDKSMLTTVTTMRVLGYLNAGNTHDYISYPWILLFAWTLRCLY